MKSHTPTPWTIKRGEQKWDKTKCYIMGDDGSLVAVVLRLRDAKKIVQSVNGSQGHMNKSAGKSILEGFLGVFLIYSLTVLMFSL